MARTPERSEPKLSVQAHMSQEVHAHLVDIVQERSVGLRSFSQLVETILLWLRYELTESSGDAVVRELMRVKAMRMLTCADLSRKPPVRRVHVTLDRGAARFLNDLASEYPGAFGNKDDVLDMAGAYACLWYEREPCYLQRRLEQVRIVYR